MSRAYIAIGSNIDPETNIPRALALLGEIVHITGLSTFYRTAPLGRLEQEPFINGVTAIETMLLPPALKEALRGIEESLGRRRVADKYAPRPIDLDILLYDALSVRDGKLVIPDPEISARAFLAVPLFELAPALVLPDSGRAIAEIAAEFTGHGMEPLPVFSERLRREMRDESSAG